MICVGSISVDLYFRGDNFTCDDKRYHLALGGKYYADFFFEDIGGGAVNVAVGAAKLGLKAAVFGKIGENGFKEMILKKLADKAVATRFCQVEDDYYKISAIILNKNGERTIIHYEKPTHLIRQFFLHKELKKAKNIYFSPLPHLSLKEKKRMITYLKGDQTLTFVNFSAVDCRRPISELVDFFEALDILIINAHEFSLMIKKPYEKIDFFNLKINLPFLKEKILVITDGEKGSYGYYRDQFFYQEVIKPKKIVDTTGCGDAYTAGFIAQYLRTGNIPISMQKGAEYSAKKIARLGPN